MKWNKILPVIHPSIFSARCIRKLEQECKCFDGETAGVLLSALSLCDAGIKALSCDIAGRQSRELLLLCVSLPLIVFFLFDSRIIVVVAVYR
jgi:hypothetical protein